MSDAQINDFPSLFSVKGKVVVVTGGSRGLGLTAASAYVLHFTPFILIFPFSLSSQLVIPYLHITFPELTW